MCGHCPESGEIEKAEIRFREKLCDAANHAFFQVLNRADSTDFDLGDRGGGYLSCRRVGLLVPVIYPRLLGVITNGRDSKYHEFSLKKPNDILNHPDKDIELSSQIRDPENEIYGGAVKVKACIHGLLGHYEEYILSFSGLPEMLDEALVLLTAVYSGCTSMEHAKELAAISKVTEFGNTFFLENEWV